MFINCKKKSCQHSGERQGAFHAMGTVANTLFRVLGVEYAEKMDNTIQTMNRSENHTTLLFNNYTLILEATANVIKNSTTSQRAV